MQVAVNKTVMPQQKDLSGAWHLLDAKGQVLGRLATRIACLLMGKGKPIFVRHRIVGDHVVIINAREVAVTGKKREQKLYKNYSGYPGGLRQESYNTVLGKYPTRIIERAVKGMLPRNKLGDAMLKRLKVYAGSEHQHHAQLKRS